MPPTDADRTRSCATVHRYGADGLLSHREVEEAIEQVFRARSLADLDALIARLPPAPHIRAEITVAHGPDVTPPRRARPDRPWWRGIVMWSSAVSVFWVVVWLATGPGGKSLGIPNTLWLLLSLIGTWAMFAARLLSRHRRVLRGQPPKRRRLL
jgi:hypothetical protein